MALRYYLPTLPELRAVADGYWGSSTEAERAARPVGDPDPDVLELVADPFEDVDDVGDRLAALEALFRERDDRRAVFLTVYCRMTGAVGEAIAAGRFRDDAWVRSYLVAFADYYRRALAAFERGDHAALPRAWELAFGASVGGDTLLLQDALLGINAHINDDLAFTVRDVSIDPDRSAKRADHDAINGILEALIDDVQDALVTVYGSAAVDRLDDLGGRADEAVAHLGLVGTRDLAWRNAVLLTDAPAPASVKRLVRWRVHAVATGAAHIVLAPAFDPGTDRALREIEGTSPPLDAFREAFLG